MRLPTTEKLPTTEAIDSLTPANAAVAFLNGQHAAISVVHAAVAEIDRGADVMVAAILSGHSLIYAAAGSSGLMALADASELSGTFGIPADLVHVHMAGGVPIDGNMPGDTEDDAEAAEDAVHNIVPGDVVIVLSASGTTPYALAVAKCAKTKGGTIIAIANNPSTPLLEIADVPICLETPPEVIAGSTRLGAATAQKAALNLMSSLMGVKLGHVYQGLMVNVVADNAKLLKRAAGIVSTVAEVSTATAEVALNSAGGDSKAAILIAKGCTAKEAADLLTKHKGHLKPCLQSFQTLTRQSN